MLGPELGVSALALRGPSGPPLSIDFQTNLYHRAGKTSATFVGMSGTTFSRSGAGVASWSDGSLAAFAANAPRITDRGLLLEAAATNLLHPSTNPTIWPSVSNVTVATVPSVSPVLAAPARVVSTGNAGGYLATINAIPYVSGAVYSVQVWYEADGNGGALAVLLPGSAVAYRGATGVWTYSGSGFSAGSDVPVAGNIRRATLTLNSPVTANGRLGVGPNSATSGQALIVHAAQVEAGTSATSLIVTAGASGTRGADNASLTVPAGAATYEAIYGGGLMATGAVTPGATFDLVAGRPWIGSGNELKRLIMT
ncbi:MAG: hypothetical protein KKA16_06770 [Alphaproteobacteria bacterium]|uniref:Uncharacterized protein n=1 Tax=viral metagenome TaxID=1070528 RepID=A0A6H1ZPK4_9ZZZZ|nr:hypothetical protein [Alphaproteobacteria bacterium]MBU2377775.1 hypothetical protein [Alphaproteobacteria bacterium]